MMAVLCQNIKHIQINERQNNFGIYFQKTTKMEGPLPTVVSVLIHAAVGRNDRLPSGRRTSLYFQILLKMP